MTTESESHGHSHPIVPWWVYRNNAIALGVLMLLTVWAAFFNLGVFNPIVAMTIAVVKAGLIVLFFMNVKYSTKLTWVFVGGGFFWLLILLLLILPDFVSRDWTRRGQEWESYPGVQVLNIDRAPTPGADQPSHH